MRVSDPFQPEGKTMTITLNDQSVRTLKQDAAHARKEATLEVSTAPIWDGIVAERGEMKRSAIVRTVLEASGEWKDTPQAVDGIRTPFGNTWQRFAARYDAALKRAVPAEDRKTALLTSAGRNATLEEVTAEWEAAQR
jgi:hypothetical protein